MKLTFGGWLRPRSYFLILLLPPGFNNLIEFTISSSLFIQDASFYPTSIIVLEFPLNMNLFNLNVNVEEEKIYAPKYALTPSLVAQTALSFD